MKWTVTYLCAMLIILLTACTSAHVITGTPRAPIDPWAVKIYSQAPDHFEEIALLTASSRGSWALTTQQKVNEVVNDLKKEAAKLGANGVLLQGFDEVKGDSVTHTSGNANTTGYGNIAHTTGSTSSFTGGVWHQTGKAVAIYVPPNVE